jgi:hypothetical protein
MCPEDDECVPLPGRIKRYQDVETDSDGPKQGRPCQYPGNMIVARDVTM